jgi:hypothetical protein
LASSCRLLGEHARDTARLEEAVATCRAALDAAEAAGARYYIDWVRTNLSKAETALAEQRGKNN